MSSWAAVKWRAVVFLGAFVLLFAPATGELSGGSNREARVPLQARILSPTGSEAIEGVSLKLTTRHSQIARQRSRSESIPVAVAPAAAILLSLWASFSGGFLSAKALSLFAFRTLAPRGPPGFSAV